MKSASINEVMDLLKARPELYDSLNAALDIENENEVTIGWRGFEWYELPEKPQVLRMLVLKKILKVASKKRGAHVLPFSR